MESGDLRVFQIVAREGSITKAAAELNYVQSNVTARIQQLEAELQTTLFTRHNRGMRLTPSGSLLLSYADKVIGLLEEAYKVVTESTEPSGALTIGSLQTTAAVRLPKPLAAYLKTYPQVHLSLIAGHTRQLIDKVLRYELDGAFVSGPVHHPELLEELIFEEELVIVSEFAINSLHDAVVRPALVFSGGCSYRELMEQWLHACSVHQPQIMEFGTLEAIIGGVSAGLGISMLPKTVIAKAEAEGNLRSHAIELSLSKAQTVFIRRQDAFVSAAMRKLLDAVKQYENGLQAREEIGTTERISSMNTTTERMNYLAAPEKR
ncbi:LysR substrate-binding domain-containing protein [Paenibacillus thalictri]|uniref:LysR family transcriptional regulator n=1 Tax=Paenibacillus thalictri TaxID=2527873 RepID=A0A4Q9DVU0_9BACL|nr:LysR substrate-binding domain-containing protein [Paenibacillus thalictri]TBL81174.1 LysR family transcriptional regulator [Paenibacillus thalictri]